MEGLITRARHYLERTAFESYRNRSGLPPSATPADVIEFCAKSHLEKQQKFTSPHQKLNGSEQPIWAFIYFSLRLGMVKTALEFAGHGDDATQEIRRCLAEYDRGNGWLPEASRLEVEKTYRRMGLGHVDVFRRAVYAVLSKAETNETFPGNNCKGLSKNDVSIRY